MNKGGITSLDVAIIGAGQFALGALAAIGCAAACPQFWTLALLESLFGAGVLIVALLWKIRELVSGKEKGK